MNLRPIVIAAALAAGVAAPAVAQAPAAPATARQHIVPLSQAVATAEQALGARAFDVELDRDKGVLVYEIELVKDGREVEARVDALTGRMLPASAKPRLRLPTVSDSLRAAQSAPRTLSQVISMVERATKGKVSEIGLERSGGRHYYEVELAGAADREVRVDLLTAAISPVVDD
jgi:uncharacterized membrane protein YkoI